jgi:hypothetical protein
LVSFAVMSHRDADDGKTCIQLYPIVRWLSECCDRPV